jgi:hypothetical protein
MRRTNGRLPSQVVAVWGGLIGPVAARTSDELRCGDGMRVVRDGRMGMAMVVECREVMAIDGDGAADWRLGSE